MSRYVKRAEGVTRLVEVNQDTNLEANPSADYRDYWKSALGLSIYALEDFAKDEIKDEEKFILFSDNCGFFANLYKYGSRKWAYDSRPTF